MKRTNKSSSPVILLVLLIIIFVSTFFAIAVEARQVHKQKKRSHKQRGGEGGSGKYTSRPGPAQSPGISPSPPPYDPTHFRVFNLMSFGAKGDGFIDYSKALEAAWKAACKVEWATIKIPSEYKFLINPIMLEGPCLSHLVLQIDGTLLAPPNVGSWPKSSLFQWINLKWIHNFTFQGTGIIDGQGSAWWDISDLHYIQKRSSKYITKMKPTALRFYASNNITIRDIKIVNRPLVHLKFDDSGSVQVHNITISSPENSPNTDGIHIQKTKDVEIRHSNIGCEDDCVSIQTGCSNIHVHHINCGPGHGISVGSLGKDRSLGCVHDIIVKNITMQNTLSGVGIKTWQGGVGCVKNVSFSNIHVSDVKVPIMIDQYYCDKHLCKNQTRAVAISGITYNQIIGTYSAQPIHLTCSNNIPCTNVDLTDIQLTPSSKSRGFQKALCWNTYGQSLQA